MNFGLVCIYIFFPTGVRRGAQDISANENCEINGPKNGNHSKTSGSRQRKLKQCQSKILLLFTVFLKYYISLQIQFGILLFSRQNMHYLTLISELVVCGLSIIVNKQEFVKKKTFCCFNFGNSEIGQKLDGKAEIEKKIDRNSEMRRIS